MTCTLCHLQLPKNPILDNENAFCCDGCQTVFQVLQAQGEADHFQDHPLFQEAVRTRLISNPAWTEKQEEVDQETQKIYLELDGMWCPACAEAIRLILSRKKGVSICLVDYATDMAIVEFSPLITSKEQVISHICRLGYQAKPFFEAENQKSSRSLWLRFGVSAFCTLNLMMLAYPLYVSHWGILLEGYEQLLGWISLVLSLTILTYAAWPIWKCFQTTLRTGVIGMESLIAMGISAAFFYSSYQLLHGNSTQLYYESMGMVITFVLLGRILERRAKFSAKETLFRVTKTLPNKGYKRIKEGEYRSVSIKEIEIGDRFLARQGEKIVLDGVVVSGEGWVDESVMTGEAQEQLKRPSSQLIGGSVVKQGHVEYRVTATQDQSFLSKKDSKNNGV